MPPVSSPPPLFGVRLALDLCAEWRTRSWTVVHDGQSAVVLTDAARTELCVVTAPHRGLVPGGLQLLSPDDFTGLRRAASAALRDDRSLVLPWSGVHGPVVDLSVVPEPAPSPTAIAAVLAALAGEDDAPVQRERAAELAVAAAGLDATTGAILLDLVGAGPGTTPAGDDVVVGVLAGLHLLDLGGAVAYLRSRLVLLLSRTTLASRHELSAALAGRFPESVLALADALRPTADPDAVPRAVRALASWGATSGLDLAAGLAGAVAALHPDFPTSPITDRHAMPRSTR